MWHELIRILFPSPCLSCGYLSEALCTRCFHSLPFSPHRRELGGLSVVSPYFYEEDALLAHLIHPFKYSHQADLFRIFAPGLTESLRLLSLDLREFTLIPVPLHKSRLLERGYNQAELLARVVAKRLGCRMWNGLVRSKDTGFQSHVKSRKEREENIRGAFELSKWERFGFAEDGQLVLVDDIVTSGSTLLACAEVLRAAGVRNISALTLADREKKAHHRD